MGMFNTTGNILSNLPGSTSGQSRVLNAAGGSTLAIAPATGPAAPFVAAAGVAMMIAAKIFGGANPKQVPASQIEQAFEAAADNLYSVAEAGMISPEDAAAGMQALLQQGIAYFGQAQLGVAGQKGAANMTKVINDEITAVLNLGAVPSVPLDLLRARSLYVTAAGWYPASLQAAATLTDAFLTSLTGISGTLGSLTSSISTTLASVAGSPSKLLLFGVGLFVLVLVLRRSH